jgi:type IV pilus assembly protein PilQ
MTHIRSIGLLLAVCAAGTLLHAAPPIPFAADAAAPAPRARITSISSRGTLKGTSLVIQASEPVGYVAMRPDPLTVVVELRNVVADGAATGAAKARGPIAGVAVEPAESLGAPASRIRIKLTQPVAHHVRTIRSFVIVDFDKTSDPDMAGLLSAAPTRMAPEPPPPPDRPARTAVDPIAALGLNGSSAVALGVAARQTVAPQSPGASPQPPGTTPQPPPAPGPIGTGQPTERRYTGHPVSLDFQGADLRAVLRTFAEISGLNIVIDPKVNGTVDVALKDVPWDQALDQILRANGLGYVVDGTIVRVAPLEALEAEQKKLSDLAKAQAEAGQMATLTRQLSYAKGEEIVAMLKAASVLSLRGTAYVDPRTNTLIITDLSERLQNSTQLINTLDTPQPQVEIEARIVQVSKTYARALGVQWGFNGRVDPALGNTTPLAFPSNGSLAGRAASTPANPAPAGTVANYSVPGAPAAIGLALGSVNGAFNLDVALSALEQSGNARLLSTPRVTTQSNISAEIAQGVQVPYQTVANNTVITNFKDAALILRVTPQITAANTVIMQISVDKGSVGESFNGVPSINTQRANTTVLVGDGQTTVIGGIYASDERASTDKTPGLGSVPLLKWLFKRDTLNDQSTELLIFITPRIIKT